MIHPRHGKAIAGADDTRETAYDSQCLYIIRKRMSSQCLYMEQRLKTAQVNMRIMPALKEAAEKAASDDQRSLTSLIEKLLTDYLRKKGYLPKA
jgi:hypothetical protein